MDKNLKKLYVGISFMCILFVASNYQSQNTEKAVQTADQFDNLLQKQFNDQQKRLNRLELEVLRQKVEALQKSYISLDPKILQQYQQLLSAIGFDLYSYLDGIKKILNNSNIDNITELELEAYLHKLQQSLRLPKDALLTLENFNFLKSNHYLLVDHIARLHDLLEGLAPRLPFGYRFQEEHDLLEKATSLVQKIKSIDVKSLKYSASQLRFMLSVASVAIPIISTLWTQRSDFKMMLNNINNREYRDLFRNINQTFHINERILNMLLAVSVNKVQQHAAGLPPSVYHVPNVE